MARPGKRPKRPRPLTEEQQRFVDEYVRDPNATLAYRRAYPGVGYATAGANGHKLLKNPQIQGEIAAARAAQQRRIRVDADRVVREIARVGFADVLDLFDADGCLLPLRDVPIGTRRAVASVKVRQERVKWTTAGETTVTRAERVVEVKLADKLTALEKLGKHLGLFRELPPLEAVLALLPDAVRESVRRELAAALPPAGGAGGDRPDRSGGGPGGGGPDDGAAQGGPGGGVPGAGPGAGPVAAGGAGQPVPAADPPVLPPGGEVAGGGGPDAGPLFDDP